MEQDVSGVEHNVTNEPIRKTKSNFLEEFAQSPASLFQSSLNQSFKRIFIFTSQVRRFKRHSHF